MHEGSKKLRRLGFAAVILPTASATQALGLNFSFRMRGTRADLVPEENRKAA